MMKSVYVAIEFKVRDKDGDLEEIVIKGEFCLTSFQLLALQETAKDLRIFKKGLNESSNLSSIKGG